MSTIGPSTGSVPLDPAAHAPAVAGAGDGAPANPLNSALFSGNAELASIAEGHATLGRGSRGDAVRLVQTALARIGYRIAADAVFGPRTFAALANFQHHAGLRATGSVDEATLRALDARLSGGGAGPHGAGTAGGSRPAGGGAGATGTSGTGQADPAALAEADLSADAAHGPITQNELAKAESDIASRYGPERARQALVGALGHHMGDLSIDAVGWLQGKYGSMAGHIDRYQQILESHLKGAKLLDLTSTDGKIDGNAEIFKTDASGKVTVERLDSALRDRIKIEGAIVDACYAMNDHPHDFALVQDQTFNGDLWATDAPGTGVFHPKAGVKPSDAVADIFAHADAYKFECATGIEIVYYKAMLDTMGPAAFDAANKDLVIGPWKYDGSFAQHWHLSGSGSSEASAQRSAQLMPGDYSYFRNFDVSDSARAGGWQGENVIYLGNGNYFGHPFGVTTGQHIVDYLNQNRIDNPTHSAALLDLQARLDSRIIPQ